MPERENMSVGERDKKMSDMASDAAAAFCRKYEMGDKQIGSSPETYLQYSIPYLTVRTLQRQEKVLNSQEAALKSLEADSRWIKWFAIVTGILTVVLVILTIVLARYALEDLLHSQPAMMKLLQLAPILLSFFGTLFVWFDTKRISYAIRPGRAVLTDDPKWKKWRYNKAELGFVLLFAGILWQGVNLVCGV